MDYYSTPPWAARAVLRHLDRPRGVYDPCAGTGALLRAASQHWPGVHVAGCEVDACRAAEAGVTHGDGLAAQWHGDLVFTNPPYRGSESWVQRALEQIDAGHVREYVALLRLGWLESRRRNEILLSHLPADVWVLPVRPSFRGVGTDATAYAWFRWTGERPAYSRLRVLGVSECR